MGEMDTNGYTDRVNQYNVETNGWTQMGPYNGGPVGAPGVVSFINKTMHGRLRLFEMGGDLGDFLSSPKIYKYDADDDDWYLRSHILPNKNFAHISPLECNLEL